MAKTYIPTSFRLAHTLLMYLIKYQRQLGLNMDEQELTMMNALINCLEAYIAVIELPHSP